MLLDSIEGVLHRIRCRLYPGTLPGSKGRYIARTDPEARLTIEQVCYALKSRGGYEGSLADLIKCVRLFQDELIYQVCDGYSVDLGYYTVNTVVGGTFDSLDDFHRKDHPVRFRFLSNDVLRETAKNIVVDLEGFADVTGSIESFEDINISSINRLFSPGDQFRVRGRKMKISGDKPGTGLYFVPLDEGGGEVKSGPLGVNTPTEIIGVVPPMKSGRYRLEIRTQYTGAVNKPLKEIRVIPGGFVIETRGEGEAPPDALPNE